MPSQKGIRNHKNALANLASSFTWGEQGTIVIEIHSSPNIMAKEVHAISKEDL